MFRMTYYDYELIAHTEKTRKGFKHGARLLYPDGRDIAINVNYINRTWETWQYKTACTKVLNKAIAIEKENARACFMTEKCYKRLTEKRQAELAQWIEHDRHYSAVIDDLYCFLLKVYRA